jgi:hypothetical protein
MERFAALLNAASDDSSEAEFSLPERLKLHLPCSVSLNLGKENATVVDSRGEPLAVFFEANPACGWFVPERLVLAERLVAVLNAKCPPPAVDQSTS